MHRAREMPVWYEPVYLILFLHRDDESNNCCHLYAPVSPCNDDPQFIYASNMLGSKPNDPTLRHFPDGIDARVNKSTYQGRKRLNYVFDVPGEIAAKGVSLRHSVVLEELNVSRGNEQGEEMAKGGGKSKNNLHKGKKKSESKLDTDYRRSRSGKRRKKSEERSKHSLTRSKSRSKSKLGTSKERSKHDLAGKPSHNAVELDRSYSMLDGKKSKERLKTSADARKGKVNKLSDKSASDKSASSTTIASNVSRESKKASRTDLAKKNKNKSHNSNISKSNLSMNNTPQAAVLSPYGSAMLQRFLEDSCENVRNYMKETEKQEQRKATPTVSILKQADVSKSDVGNPVEGSNMKDSSTTTEEKRNDVISADATAKDQLTTETLLQIICNLTKNHGKQNDNGLNPTSQNITQQSSTSAAVSQTTARLPKAEPDSTNNVDVREKDLGHNIPVPSSEIKQTKNGQGSISPSTSESLQTSQKYMQADAALSLPQKNNSVLSTGKVTLSEGGLSAQQKKINAILEEPESLFRSINVSAPVVSQELRQTDVDKSHGEMINGVKRFAEVHKSNDFQSPASSVEMDDYQRRNSSHRQLEQPRRHFEGQFRQTQELDNTHNQSDYQQQFEQPRTQYEGQQQARRSLKIPGNNQSHLKWDAMNQSLTSLASDEKLSNKMPVSVMKLHKPQMDMSHLPRDVQANVESFALKLGKSGF